MYKSLFRCFYFFLFIVMSIIPGFGYSETPDEIKTQNTIDETDIYDLGEVIVTGARGGVEQVGTVREIKADEIRAKGARTLNEALELMPGLDIRTGADGTPRIDVRGFRSRHVILLIDGIPFNSTFDGQFNPAVIPVENIAKIKLSYGNHSVLYGEGGLGGVINIVTKKGKQGIHGSASGEASERSSYLGKFDVSGAQENLNFFVSGSIVDSDGYPLADDFSSTPYEDGDLRENSDKRRKNFFANMGYAPNDAFNIGIVFNYLQGEYGKPPATIDKKMDSLFAKNLKYERVDDYEGFSGQLSFSYNLPGPLEVRGWIFANQYDEENNGYDDDNYNTQKKSNSYHEDSTTTTEGATLQTKYDLESAGILTMGLNARTEKWEADGEIMEKSGLRSYEDERRNDIYSLALEYEVFPMDNLGLVLGYSHHWLEKDEGENDDTGTFLIGAHYDVLDGTRIKASAARKIRFPSIRQLYEEDGGNSELTTEKSYNYELGCIQRLPWSSQISLTGFFNDVKDYIEKDPDGISMNNEKYRFKGFELTAENRFIENMMIRLGYTFLDTEDKSSNTEKEELQYRPKHKITFECKYDFEFGLSAYANIIHLAGQYFYSNDSPLIKKELDDYTLVNLKLEQQLHNDLLSLYIGADNLFDEDYAESYSFPRAGQTIYGGFEVRF
ncbi:MAG: TonB-dependent receptor [Desulfobacterales bacterium]|nr:TonB-dependent receptor [Desulfobacterales bacterium]